MYSVELSVCHGCVCIGYRATAALSYMCSNVCVYTCHSTRSSPSNSENNQRLRVYLGNRDLARIENWFQAVVCLCCTMKHWPWPKNWWKKESWKTFWNEWPGASQDLRRVSVSLSVWCGNSRQLFCFCGWVHTLEKKNQCCVFMEYYASKDNDIISHGDNERVQSSPGFIEK